MYWAMYRSLFEGSKKFCFSQILFTQVTSQISIFNLLRKKIIHHNETLKSFKLKK